MREADMHAWRDGYDAAGILDDDPPPAGLADLVRDANVVIASDLSRAIQSAERLTTTHSIRISPLLREAPTDIPRWIHVPLPRAFWEWTMVVRWGYRILRGTDAPPDVLARATRAANWLDDLSLGNAHVVVVTHGIFRRLLARRLEHIGWRPSGKRRSYQNWSVWSLSK
jgi:broad specificity phosphatase PhoE